MKFTVPSKARLLAEEDIAKVFCPDFYDVSAKDKIRKPCGDCRFHAWKAMNRLKAMGWKAPKGGKRG